jgi:protein-S-isoprenylcysteine O-methyltransferase Ste14
MRASAIEFRLRMAINAAIIILGFWAPWIESWDLGKRISLLEWIALQISRIGIVNFTAAVPVVIVFAALFAAAGVLFRVWGTAYLGPATVNSTQMHAGGVIADGPYRYVRNPLYLGLWCMAAAMAFLMPASGALFAMMLLTIFLLRLTLAEEAFLSAQLGDPYQAYLRSAPRFFPRLRAALPSAGTAPHWLRVIFTELTSIGIFIAIAVFARTYDREIADRVILIFFGASVVVRALMPGLAVRTESSV